MISYLYGKLIIYKDRYQYDAYSAKESSFNKSVTFSYPCKSAYSCYPIEGQILPGTYLFEVWGAQGGMGCAVGCYEGGKGGYTNATFTILRTINLSFYIGGTGDGQKIYINQRLSYGGFNGGGFSRFDDRIIQNIRNIIIGGGGGGTDIRLDGSLTSRIIVAGGGGGTVPNFPGGYGGGLIGGNGTSTNNNISPPTGGTQISGGKGLSAQGDGEFGYGGNAKLNEIYLIGGGGGYYGGGAGIFSRNPISGAGGSGHVNISSNIYVVQDYNLSPGNSYFPSPTSGYETGHSGPGAIRITLLQDIPSQTIPYKHQKHSHKMNSFLS